MDFVNWYKKRGARFILKRAQKLRERYDFNPGKAISRIQDCVDKLINFGCYPTFFVPGVVVKRNASFIHELQEKGCEIGVHGYQHIDMRSIPPQRANKQLEKSVDLFRKVDLQWDGFRCPYLSISDGLIQNLEPGLFNYSSNRAITWIDPVSNDHQKNLLFETIGGFYQPTLAQSSLSLPFYEETILEIPVSVPDDLQMRDGLDYTPEEILASLLKTFKQIHQRGELFNLMFHPELASLLIEPFVEVLNGLQNIQDRVWIARLKDISGWWKEKDDQKINIERSDGEFHLVIEPQQRATMLQKGLNNHFLTSDWDENYQRILEKRIVLSKDYLPLIGVSLDSPDWVTEALSRKGYIVVNLEDWVDCTIKVNNQFLNGCNNSVEFISSIEELDVPLLRFWPWPDGCRSALCLSGDLDALSLIDYATRLLPM